MRKKKILIADDDQSMVSLLKIIFEMEGYQVTSLVDFHTDVVDFIKCEKPALVLMDVHLGGFNGVDIIKKIREASAINQVKIIMTSGMNMETECIQSGANEFVQKPFMPEELLGKVQKLLL